MDPTVVGIVVFALAFGGALTGIWARTRLPDHHFSAESTDTIKTGIGLIATLTALVLGLVTASAKSSFDSVDASLLSAAGDIVTLDRALARYGPETADIREGLRRTVAQRIDATWHRDATQQAMVDPIEVAAAVESIASTIHRLPCETEEQRWSQAQAAGLADSLLGTRWRIFAGLGTSVPVAFLVVLIFWLVMTFTSFGLLAPRNATVVVVLFVCALSVGGSVFLVLELQSPFDGVITVSAGPLEYALARMGK